MKETSGTVALKPIDRLLCQVLVEAEQNIEIQEMLFALCRSCGRRELFSFVAIIQREVAKFSPHLLIGWFEFCV